MSGKRYPEGFKREAVRQVVDRGYSVSEIAERLGVTMHSLYDWKKKYGPDAALHEVASADQAEIQRLKKELKRVTEERDILKKAAGLRAEVGYRRRPQCYCAQPARPTVYDNGAGHRLGHRYYAHQDP